MKLRRLPSNPN